MDDLVLPTTDHALFHEVLPLLRRYARPSGTVRTQNFGVAIAALMHRGRPAGAPDGPPQRLFAPDQGPPATAGVMQQQICDPTFGKQVPFAPVPRQRIHKPFMDSFKAPSPGVNNWRNSFDLQAGLACDAPWSDTYLRSETFLGEQRWDCPFRDDLTGACDSPSGLPELARTCFNPNKRDVPPGPETTGVHTPKLLTRGTQNGVHGYWIVEPTDAVLAALIGDPNRRVPALPFALMLYGGSPYLQAWGMDASIRRLRDDLVLDPARFSILFDTDPAQPENAAALALLGQPVPDAPQVPPPVPPAGAGAPPLPPAGPLAAPRPFEAPDPSSLQAEAGRVPDEARRRALLEKARRGHARALTQLAGWLTGLGYAPTEQTDGFDLLVESGERAHLFEVKTWHNANLHSQLRHAVAQLQEYRYRNRDLLPEEVALYVVLDHKPIADSWVWSYLHEDRGITPCWMDGGRLRTFPRLSLDSLRAAAPGGAQP